MEGDNRRRDAAQPPGQEVDGQGAHVVRRGLILDVDDLQLVAQDDIGHGGKRRPAPAADARVQPAVVKGDRLEQGRRFARRVVRAGAPGGDDVNLVAARVQRPRQLLGERPHPALQRRIFARDQTDPHGDYPCLCRS